VKYFYVERMTQEILVRDVVSTLGVSRRILDKSDALEPWSEERRTEGLCVLKGDPILGVVQAVENRKEPGFWGCCVWRVDSQRVRSPCGLIGSAWGWLLVEGKRKAMPMVWRFILRKQLLGYYAYK
jgi:hypothetical protein